jgi:integrase
MISRENWKKVNEYLDYRARVLQHDEDTVRCGWVVLRHLLEWADDVPFHDAHKIRRTFPEYVISARNDGKDEPIGLAHMAKILSWSRRFFEWLRIQEPRVYRAITPIWVQTLRPRRSLQLESQLPSDEYWPLEDVIKVLETPTEGLRFMRDKAGLAFMFISGMRPGAFVTLPIRSVDLQKNKVHQLPQWGVHTKNSKAAITHLLPIPQLRVCVDEWDAFVRAHIKDPRVAWYTSLTHDGLGLRPDDIVGQHKFTGRRSAFYQGLQELCEIAGVPWRSPHKIRHGHGVYGRKRSKTIDDYKAVSKNMMHKTVATTDALYSRMVEDEAGAIIASLLPE